MNAMDDVKLEPGEKIESIVFGFWGWGEYDEDPGYVPKDKQGVLLTPEEARPLMEGWTFKGPFGGPKCYASYFWTNRRVFWVSTYDGATSLVSAPRNPKAFIPEMSGGG